MKTKIGIALCVVLVFTGLICIYLGARQENEHNKDLRDSLLVAQITRNTDSVIKLSNVVLNSNKIAKYRCSPALSFIGSSWNTMDTTCPKIKVYSSWGKDGEVDTLKSIWKCYTLPDSSVWISPEYYAWDSIIDISKDTTGWRMDKRMLYKDTFVFNRITYGFKNGKPFDTTWSLMDKYKTNIDSIKQRIWDSLFHTPEWFRIKYYKDFSEGMIYLDSSKWASLRKGILFVNNSFWDTCYYPNDTIECVILFVKDYKYKSVKGYRVRNCNTLKYYYKSCILSKPKEIDRKTIFSVYNL